MERYPGAESQFIPMDSQLLEAGEVPRLSPHTERNASPDSIACSIAHECRRTFVFASASRPYWHGRGDGPGVQEHSAVGCRSGSQNKGLRDAVLKTLVAFMNTEGGTLLIGVEDSGKIFGLEKDLSIAGGSHDRFLQLLNSLVADRIGVQYSPNVIARMDSVEGKPVCVVDASKSAEPVFMSGQRGREFYVRVGNTTRSLDAEETLSYIEHNSQ